MKEQETAPKEKRPRPTHWVFGVILSILLPLPFYFCFDSCNWTVWSFIVPNFHWINPLNYIILAFFVIVFGYLTKKLASRFSFWSLLVLLLVFLPFLFNDHVTYYTENTRSNLVDYYRSAVSFSYLLGASNIDKVLFFPYFENLTEGHAYTKALFILIPFYSILILATLWFLIKFCKIEGNKLFLKISFITFITYISIVFLITVGGIISKSTLISIATVKIFDVKSVDECYQISTYNSRPRGLYPKEIENAIKKSRSRDDVLGEAKSSCVIWQAVKTQNPLLCVIGREMWYTGDCMYVYMRMFPSYKCSGLKNQFEEWLVNNKGNVDYYIDTPDSVYRECALEEKKIEEENRF